MKILKKFSFTCILLILLVTTVLGSLEFKVTAKSKEYTGEELFKGIMFGVGGAQTKIPEIWPEDVVHEIDNKEINERADMVIEEIKKQDNQYFDKLKSTIYSKNHVAFKNHLEHVNPLLKNALIKIDEKYTYKYNDNTSVRGGTLAIGPVVYVGAAFTTVAAVTHAAVATAANVVAAVNWVWGPKSKVEALILKQMIKN